MKAEVSNTNVLINNKSTRILSGEVHYFRIHPDYWHDRLEKLKACGLNTVATYMPWNLHEPQPGKFNFEGILDVNRFIQIAADLGLYVMLRPGPYICSEWDFGGFPAWLMNLPGIRLRCMNQAYMNATQHYFNTVLEMAKPHFCNNNGAIIAIQIENGYASYGNDMDYMYALKQTVLNSGFEGIIFTADGDTDTRLVTENIPEVWKTMMLGDNPQKGIDTLNSQQNYPPMISEFWGGAGTRNGIPTRMVSDDQKASDLEKMLEAGAHVNIYMFAGGTNFGFLNGGLNLPPLLTYTSFTTSYDVRAPLSESGELTPKYYAFQEVLKKYNTDYAECPTRSIESKSYGRVELTAEAPLLTNSKNIADQVIISPSTLTMEEAGQDYGFILYRTKLKHQNFPVPITIVEPRDQAWVFIDGKRVASFHRNLKEWGTPEPTVVVNVPEEGALLEILVENQGRFNFFWNMEDNHKGITRGVVLNNQQFQMNWEILTLPMRDISALDYTDISESSACPAFFKGNFEITEQPCDTFLRIPTGKRGFCMINGFNLGRYDNNGPQFALYVPAPLLKKGQNQVEIMELESMGLPFIELQNKPELF